MQYLLGRLRHLLVVLFLVTFVTFLLVNVLPGEVAYDIAGQNASEEQVQQIREDLGLNRRFLIRYAEWFAGVVTGDWGQSFRTGEKVTTIILRAFPVSLELVIIAQIFAVALALPGVGRALIGAIYARDFLVIQGCVTFIALAYVGINFCVALCYALLDP